MQARGGQRGREVLAEADRPNGPSVERDPCRGRGLGGSSGCDRAASPADDHGLADGREGGELVERHGVVVGPLEGRIVQEGHVEVIADALAFGVLDQPHPSRVQIVHLEVARLDPQVDTEGVDELVEPGTVQLPTVLARSYAQEEGRPLVAVGTVPDDLLYVGDIDLVGREVGVAVLDVHIDGDPVRVAPQLGSGTLEPLGGSCAGRLLGARRHVRGWVDLDLSACLDLGETDAVALDDHRVGGVGIGACVPGVRGRRDGRLGETARQVERLAVRGRGLGHVDGEQAVEVAEARDDGRRPGGVLRCLDGACLVHGHGGRVHSGPSDLPRGQVDAVVAGIEAPGHRFEDLAWIQGDRGGTDAQLREGTGYDADGRGGLEAVDGGGQLGGPHPVGRERPALVHGAHGGVGHLVGRGEAGDTCSFIVDPGDRERRGSPSRDRGLGWGELEGGQRHEPVDDGERGRRAHAATGDRGGHVHHAYLVRVHEAIGADRCCGRVIDAP